ncbi:hypothetical protein [Streptomyces sp. DSM 40907]|uniref:hypothetical protein n=1 Tax=Streptomyces kutzneri TaxID=3051179 RepID=UPI0028D01165|nr:hypothetical protein [Streptomyces sp. DSM 40907]
MSEALATTAAGIIPVIVLAGVVELGVIARGTEAVDEPLTESVEAFADQIRDAESDSHRLELIEEYMRRRNRGGELRCRARFPAVLGALWAAMIGILGVSELIALDYLGLPNPAEDPMPDRSGFLMWTIASGFALLIVPPYWRMQKVTVVPTIRRLRADRRVSIARRKAERAIHGTGSSPR